MKVRQIDMETELIAAMLLKIKRLEKRVSDLEDETAWQKLLEEAKDKGVPPADLLKDILSRLNIDMNNASENKDDLRDLK